MNNVMGVSQRTITVYKLGSVLVKKLMNLCTTDLDRSIVKRLDDYTATETDLRRAIEMFQFGGAEPLADRLRAELPPEPTSKKAAAQAERTERAVARTLRRR